MMGEAKRLNRSWMLKRLQAHLQRQGIPRIQMFVMVSGTALAGFLSSVLFLRLGLHSMWLRYGLSVVTAYGVFLTFLWFWVIYYRGKLSSSLDGGDLLDLTDGVCQLFSSKSSGDPVTGINQLAEDPGGDIPLKSAFDLELDEMLVLLALLAAIGSAFVCSIYIIAIAPVLLAEMMLDGVLGVALYQRLKKIDQHYWLESAFTRTCFPFLWVLFFFIITGAVLHWYAPEALSIGGVWHHYLSDNNK